MIERCDAVARWLPGILGRGARHRRRLDGIDTVVVVSGIRGKSSAVRYLYEVFQARGYDVLAKLTGDEPTCLRSGGRQPIERDGQVRLYENARELAKHGQPEVLVTENQAIGDYTNWVFNRYFADPDVVLCTNVRQDHRDTLGRDRRAIARSLARAVPAGTPVVSGEQDPQIRGVLSQELARRDAEPTHVDVPPEHGTVPGAEVIHAIDETLAAVGEPRLQDRAFEHLLGEMGVEWTDLPNGRVFDAAAVNDVESTEAVRRALAARSAPVIQPLLYLRRDRRARTAAFRTYLEDLHDRGKITKARVVGEDARLFGKKADVPVVAYQADAPADRVLDATLADDQPVMTMGNTVADFVRDLADEVEARASEVEKTREAEAKRAVAQPSGGR